MSYFDFGDKLRSLRKSDNISQSELGKHIGLSKSIISNYENGINYPDFDNLLRIAKYFRVTTDYLLGAENERAIDISGLTESQTALIVRTVAEFVKANEKNYGKRDSF